MIYAASIVVLSLLGAIFVYLGIRSRATSLDQYITYRGKSTTALMVYSLVASSLGAWILFTPAETASWAGITGLFGYAVGAAMPLFLIGFLGTRLVRILPDGYGLIDYVRNRFGAGVARFVSLLTLLYMGTFLTAELTAIGQVLSFTLGIPMLAGCAAVMLLVFAYVFRGGLGASIQTDRLQCYLLLPLLLLVVGVTAVHLADQGIAWGKAANPELLSLTFIPGWKFGVVLLIGVTMSNLFHQGFWQRVYSMRADLALRRAFIWGGVIVIPAVFLAGFLGIFAKSAGTLDPQQPALAVFSLLSILAPVFTLVVVVLAFVLVVSSVDTLLNGMVSTIVLWKKDRDELPQDNAGGDMHYARRLTTGIFVILRAVAGSHSVMHYARKLTIGIGILGVLLGSLNIGVLYLFLLADLLCAAFAFPLLFGIYNRSITGTQAVIAGLAGLVPGALFFPAPDFSSWSGLPADMFISFLSALIVSTMLALLLVTCTKKNDPTAE